VVYNTQNHWVCGLCLLSEILNNQKKSFRNWICLQNVVFSSYLEFMTMDKLYKSSDTQWEVFFQTEVHILVLSFAPLQSGISDFFPDTNIIPHSDCMETELAIVQLQLNGPLYLHQTLPT
jgi:hypothetical protein